MHPQISQMSTDDVSPAVSSICENLCNLWINPFVNKHHVVKQLRLGAGGILRAARKFRSFVLRIRRLTTFFFISVQSVANDFTPEPSHVRPLSTGQRARDR